MLWTLARALLFLLPAETAHHFTMWFLRVSCALSRPPLRLPMARARPAWSAHDGCSLWGQHYANRIGLAAGLDKGDVVPEAFFRLGFGFVEIGTVTPRPQAGNPRPRLFRLPEARALINRMGFNNPGAAVVAQRLAKVRDRAGPLWLNIGKNKDTPNADAAADYVHVLEALYPFADAFVVNVSSPNTPGLRDLQAEESLRPLLRAVRQRSDEAAQKRGVAARPLLLKLSPDLADDALAPTATLALELGFAGLVATNTTIARPISHARAAETGGLSGQPLRARSTAVLQALHAAAGDKLVLVGVGGVATAADVAEKRAAGATLVEVYSSFIYGGPGHVRRLLGDQSAR